MIPKVIHQVWIGGRPLTAEADAFHATWRTHHPGWEVILWTKETVERELFPLHNQEAYEAETNHGYRADILRLELLHRFGGVYADIDTECLRPHDALRTLPAFLGRGRQSAYEIGEQFIETSLMGSVPAHPFFAMAVRHLTPWSRAFDGYSVSARTGPQWLQREVYAYWKMRQAAATRAVPPAKGGTRRRGAAGRAADCTLPGPADLIVLPREYFYPWWVSEDAGSGVTVRTLSAHHWWGSWNTGGWKQDPTASLAGPGLRDSCLRFIGLLPHDERPAFWAVLLETAARDLLSPNVFYQLAGIACVEEIWGQHPQTRSFERRAVELGLLHAAASGNDRVREAAERALDGRETG